ncbi:MAG: FKBP-type peptidyl-prolyl cis-trans isomerase [Saprospiraceae bacterium]|nr:FKBP-type peptidyl-prolyl cis-trans isomerase [Saprospiraceae bacterium]
MKRLICLALLGIALIACNKESNEPDQDPIDQQKIEQYLRDNNITATAHPSGLYYIITEPGVGGHPSAGSNVIVRYKGYLLDGTVFDQTPGNQARPFQLASLIQGWQIGIPLLKKNGKGTFFIPSSLGYGPSGSSSVPANSVLIFEIELVDYL